ncbi:MAG TPA: HIT domain-containing protein [Terriglobales bacterium]|nr:HIT domain-containing protein [Terriglobales bacterium]
MDYLFSPWRYRYLAEARAGAEGCVLCAQLQAADDAANLVVFRGARTAVMLNLYPYTSGHLMVLPLAHCASLRECGPATRGDMMELAARAEIVLEREYHPQGFNVGMNLGAAAGAGIAGHLHLHVVPRWTGDANFMTVVGETRVLPEELATTYARLRAAFSLPIS